MSAKIMVMVWILGIPAKRARSEKNRQHAISKFRAVKLTEQQQGSRNSPINVSSVEHLSQDGSTIGSMLEGPNVGDAHAAGHDEVRSMRANEDGAGDEVEESELSFDSLGEDDGDHDRDLRRR
jgi:hypothetical protein